MGLFKKFVNNTRRPEGFLGAMMIKGMNSGHSKMADWGMDNFPKTEPRNIVDIGCGGGRNASELLRRYNDAFVTAVDYSPLSVQKAKEYNAGNIKAGRCAVREGSAASLGLGDESCELATAFETVYFWQDIEDCFREVYRVLKRSGYFIIVNESDGTDETSIKYQKIINGMKLYTIDDLTEKLKNAGFGEIKAIHHEEAPWIVVAAQK